jgi:NAD(P)-dependent dehydrogenase (short-subunit alcohol dehydrogenase family)
MARFQNATILITGAASGIGAATARLVAAEGARRLILCDVDEDLLTETAYAIPCERRLLPGDVSNPRLWAEADLSGLTHAVVNAGIAAGGPIDRTSLTEWRRVMAVNLDGGFLTLQAAMRPMQARGGAIVVTASAAALKAEPGGAAYAASKAALIQLARVAAREGAETGIRVNAIAPGGVETPMWEDAPFFADLVRRHGSEAAAYKAMASVATPLGRFAKPEEIARQIAFLLSDDAAFMTGSSLVSDGGYSL